MKRRSFVKTTLGLCLAGATAPVASRAASTGKGTAREGYELRVYSVKPGKQPVLDDYLSKAFIPAAGRLGCGPVGVFTEAADPDKLAVYVLVVFPAPEEMITFSERLASDAEYRQAGATYLDASAADPIYERIESSIIRAAEGMPQLAVTDPSKPRIMNLRIYESHNERAGRKKIEMFNTGELEVFRRAQMPVVFCGETIAGPRLPNLTYMLTFPDDEARKAGWSRFGKDDPVWKRFRSMHEYDDKEIVSKITNKVLLPTNYSQL